MSDALNAVSVAARREAIPALHDETCELCRTPGGSPVWQDENWRVVRVDDAAFPAFYRLICNQHVREFSDLPVAHRHGCIDRLVAIETMLHQALRPTKINLASLGNVAPHLHWHVIARFEGDSHFPQPIWGQAQRAVAPGVADRLAVTLAELDTRVVAALEAVRAASHD